MIDRRRVEQAQHVADRLVVRFDLRPPVDIAALVAEYAAVDDFPWDVQDLDAVLLGLDTGNSHVFLNRNRNRKRIRFTLGHELGHILVPWHVAHELTCDPDAGDTSDEETPSDSSSDPHAASIRVQEIEADAFAARVLVPKRFVDEKAASGMDAMLHALETADVSIPAGMRALAEALDPGYVFALLDDDSRVEHRWRSGTERSGIATVAGLEKGERVNSDLALRTVAEHGRALHYGRIVWWARADIDIDVPTGTGDWKSSLAGILKDIADGPEHASSLATSISAIGGALNGELPGADLSRIAALLRARFLRRTDMDQFTSHPLFEEYLYARARDLHSANRKKLLRS